MFNLIVNLDDWNGESSRMPMSRVFEHTNKDISAKFKSDGIILVDKLKTLPCLFMHEGWNKEISHVGKIYDVQQNGNTLDFHYEFDREVRKITNSELFTKKSALGISDEFEFSQTHWSVKNIDLYRFLYKHILPRTIKSKVFNFAEYEDINPTRVSAMMPFDISFQSVYESIQQAAENVGLNCKRADGFWEKDEIMQDVIQLIDCAKIVVCDCTGRNPNVFYEAGIAHTLGRNVILITQNKDDIPFDLQHLRYIKYCDNEEGRAQLQERLQERMKTLLQS